MPTSKTPSTMARHKICFCEGQIRPERVKYAMQTGNSVDGPLGTHPPKPRLKHFGAWLSESVKSRSDGKYWHRMLVEDPSKREMVIKELKAYYIWAHADAQRWIAGLVGDSLDPLGDEASDPILGYPCNLTLVGQQGCFGETFAGLIAEHCKPFGLSGWEVPAFLDRFHNTAFEELEGRDPGGEARRSFGRTGDDCLAFQRDEQGEVVYALYCESKCSLTHNTSLIDDAHNKVSKGRPVNILNIIDVLKQRGDAESLAWIDPLRRARNSLRKGDAGCLQYNLVSYVCGQKPIRSKSWIGRDNPHESYKARHPLEAVETHLHNVEELIGIVYEAGTLS